MFPPNYFDNFPPGGGCSEGLDAFKLFLNPSCTATVVVVQIEDSRPAKRRITPVVVVVVVV